jgi:hypothetical protein
LIDPEAQDEEEDKEKKPVKFNFMSVSVKNMA